MSAKPLDRSRRGLLLAIVGLAASCSREPPTWVRLSEPLQAWPRENVHGTLRWREREMEYRTHAGGLTLQVPLVAADWVYEPNVGTWRMPLALHLSERQGGEVQLRLGGQAVERVKPRELLRARERVGFALFLGELVLGSVGPEGPSDGVLECTLPQVRQPGGGLSGDDFSGAGVAMLAGEQVAVRLALPAASRLSFGIAIEPLLAVAEPGECLFRVRLDDELIYEHRRRPEAEASFSWHSIVLPPRARPQATLAFETDGELAFTAFLDPVLGPAEIGAPGRRPWSEPRPDVIVFLADTFRADNLAFGGGPPGVTPNLDALAARSVFFSHAWSTATWTLPAHASLFSGYYPPQVRINGQAGKLPAEAETLLERLTARGYRTGAVTDGGLVSARFGLDQGFAFFSERGREIEQMLAEGEAFLAADDGRPLLLFLHSYRVHWPYRVSPATLARLGPQLGIEGNAGDILAEVMNLANAQGDRRFGGLKDLDGLARTPRLLALARQLHAHYLGGVADFDEALAGFLGRLQTRSFLDSGYFFFTSDHGEAFAEHGTLFHGHDPFEEQARIPLFVAGPGLTARVSSEPVSLLDVPATVAALAGIAIPPDWPGRSLLGPQGERALLGFEAMGRADDAGFLLERELKLHFGSGQAATGEILRAFDLGVDAGEEHDLGLDAPRPHALLRSRAAELAGARTPLLRGEDAEIDAEKAAELEALGY